MQDMRAINLYSDVIFRMAVKDNILNDVVKEIGIFLDVLHSSNLTMRFLASPIYNLKFKMSLISPITSKLKLSSFVTNIIEVVISNSRTDCIEGIYKNLLRYKMAKEGGALGVLTSASQMSSKEQDECIKILEDRLQKKITVEYKVDPSIIGGVKLEFNNFMYDASVASAIRKIKRSVADQL